MNNPIVAKLLIVIAILLLAIAIILAYGLGCMNAALTGHRVYSIESEGHTYKVIMYGTSISAFHDPNCSCFEKTDMEERLPMQVSESPNTKEQ